MSLDYLQRAAADFQPPVRHEAKALMVNAGMTPDPWQARLMEAHPDRALLLCSRQAGKSMTVAAIALEQSLTNPGSTSLLVSASQRQSAELLGKVRALAMAQPTRIGLEQLSVLSMRLDNGSRIISLPGRAEVIRGYSADLLVCDEAAWIPDSLYESVRPMLAVTGGRLIALSTPFGKRGWFHAAWTGQKTGTVPWSLLTRCLASAPDSSKRSAGASPPTSSLPSTSASSVTHWKTFLPPRTYSAPSAMTSGPSSALMTAMPPLTP